MFQSEKCQKTSNFRLFSLVFVTYFIQKSISQIEQKIDQLGGLERPEGFERKVGEEQGKYIVDGEEPL
jgi:hypothetical protein